MPMHFLWNALSASLHFWEANTAPCRAAYSISQKARCKYRYKLPSALSAFCLPGRLFAVPRVSEVPAQQLNGQCFVLMLDWS